MDWTKIVVIALIAGIVGGFSYGLVGGKATVFGGTTNYDALTLDNGNLTLTNGSISIATPSTGTSTVGTVGCLQANATSSATKIKVVFATAGATSTYNGTAYWQYGTCP